MQGKRWWPWLLATLMLGGCGRTSKVCEDCVPGPDSAGNGGTPTSGGASFGGTSVGGSISLGGTHGWTPPGGAPAAVCQYGTPYSPLVVYSPLDLELSLNDILGPGPSFPPMYEGRSDAGSLRSPVGVFIRNLYELIRARVDAEPMRAALPPCADAANESACVDDWIRERGLRIYRRPLTDEQLAAYSAAYSQQLGSSTAEAAAKNVLLSMLLSPYFVYRIELGVSASKALTIAPPGGAPLPQPPVGNPLGAYDIAARLSHFLWRSSPDAQLLNSAATGRLSALDGVLAEFDRLLADPRSLRARTEQQLEWLHLEQWGKLAPGEPNGAEALERQQTESFIADVLSNRGASLTQLLTSGRQPLNKALAEQLGIDAQLGDDFEMVELDAGFYAGVLGQPAWLRHTWHPSRRGVELMSDFLCQEIPAPPANEPPLGPGATPRERISSVTMGNPACSACHGLFDPVGFALEAFDEQAHLTGFDTTGSIHIPSTGETRLLAGPSDLGAALAASGDAKNCAVFRAVQYLLQTTQMQSETQLLFDCIATNLGTGDLNLNELARQIASSAAMLRTLHAPSTAVGVGESTDPIEHALEETRGLIASLPVDDSQLLQQYQYGLMELQGLPPPK